MELCESVFQLEREAPIAGGYKKLVTLLSKKIISLVDCGMVMNSPAIAETSGSSASAPAVPDIDMPDRAGDGALHGQGGAQQYEGGEAQQLPPATNRSVAPAASSGGPRDVPVVPTSIAVDAAAGRMTIAGVEVTKDSSIVVLKAACEYMAASQSGSKAKLWRRLVSTVDKQKILEGTQLAATSLGEGLRSPILVQLAEAPSSASHANAYPICYMV